MNINPLPEKIKIIVEAQLNCSEDPQKVKQAIKNLIGIEEILFKKDKKGRLRAEINNQEGLNNIFKKIRSKQSIGVTRRLLITNSTKSKTWILFHKQAAYVNVLNVCEDETNVSLGHIKLNIHSPKPEKIIDWLSPSTSKVKSDKE
ncbi:MAG TPA: RNA-binding domain-containing protein [Nitrososphaerales archaeon]|nr:RNA-binding domain-containing protein [Nitrososphaerales archaeon]